ncbi:RNA polymerase sigma factor [Rhodobacter calidifons]|uniref:RNA polymerase sigma factor n=1 Tax=Rhodobacter calidifons TaxID=2715277 RepID=A0ABX0GB27_9RHOB|nr:RNA polymerase sigma factor [Rhodobacter calidifons]NHB78520.1 RNA polymerase sigma factor [Rhodobacter calidifons]
MTMAFDAGDETSDEALMVLYANGDRQAALALTRRVTPRVLAYAARLLSGDRAEAEDVAQETMLRLWKVAPQWRQGETKVTTWAFRVATNLCIDRQRARGRRRQLALEDAPEVAYAAPGAEGRLQAAGRLAALEAALARLPDRQRQAVVLRHLEGMTNPEIAAIMEIGIEAVESLTARGKRALAALLAGRKEALGYEDDGHAG